MAGRSSTGRAATASPDTSLITDDELDRLQDRYVEAARGAAFRIGFDFIDLKQCHRYLLNKLLASRTRPGRYGQPGEPDQFIREVVARIRSDNPGRIIATRLNVFDGVPYQKGADGLGVPCRFATPVTSSWGTDVERRPRPISPDRSPSWDWLQI